MCTSVTNGTSPSYGKRTALVLALMLLPLRALLPDVVTLRSGETIEGVIVAQSATEIRVRAGGRVRTIPKNTIRRISYGPVKTTERPPAKAEPGIRPPGAKRAPPSGQSPVRAPEAPLTSMSRLWRSAVLPGWGLFAQEERIEGALWTTALVGALFWTRGRRAALTDSHESYASVTGAEKLLALEAVRSTGHDTSPLVALGFVRDRGARNSYDHAISNHDRGIAFVSAIYCLQLARSYLAGSDAPRLFATPAAPGPTWSAVLEPDGRGGRLQVTVPVEFGGRAQ